MNNAGVYEFAPLEQITEEHFHKQFDLNVLGLLLTTQEALKHFTPPAAASSTSVRWSARWRRRTRSVYSATKGAVDTITGSLAKELGARKIRVNAVGPGWSKPKASHAAGFTRGDFHDQYVEATRRWAASASRRTSPRRWRSWLRRIRVGYRRNTACFGRTSLMRRRVNE